MNDEMTIPPSREEARAALATVDEVLKQTRTALAHGPTAPMLILWGAIWMIADLTTQFHPAAMQWLWLVLDVVGMAASWWLAARHKVKVKRPGMWRFGVCWLILFAYAGLWGWMLVDPAWPQTASQWYVFEPEFRHLSAYAHTVPMFAYVIMGLWLGRFLTILGLVVTVLVVAGLYLAPHYYYVWLAVAGGGSLILSGIFIRKLWK